MAEHFRDDYIAAVLGFDDDVATEICDVQGYGSIAVFVTAQDGHIRDLVKRVRETPRDPQDDPDEMFVVSALDQRLLEQVVDYGTYIDNVSRAHTAARGALANLGRISAYYRGIGGDIYDEPTFPPFPEKFDNRNSESMIENMFNWLDTSYGKNKIPMTAYAREHEFPQDDPGFLNPDPEGEMRLRAKLVGDVFTYNNRKFWAMVDAVTHGTDAWDIVRSFAYSRDGRGAFRALLTHYRGASNRNSIRQNAHSTLENTFWNGTARRFEFSTFLARLTGAFSDLDRMGDARSEFSKVQFLLSKISTGCGLDSAMSHIRGHPVLAHDFRGACNYLANDAQDHAARQARVCQRRNVSAMNSGRGNGQSGGRGNSGGGRNFNRGGGGRGRGRGGRGQGRGRGDGGAVWSLDGRFILNNGGYPNEIWRQMAPQDRAEVLRQRARANDQRGREISALEGERRGQEQVQDAPQEEVEDFSMTRRRGGRGGRGGHGRGGRQ